jgi:hypothetical protein
MIPMQSTIASRAPFGIAAAAVVVAVVLGATFINSDNDQTRVVGVPTASPNASTGPTASPDSQSLANANTASCPGITNLLRCIEPGTYQLGDASIWPAAITVDVPQNWWMYEGGTGYVGILVQTKENIDGSGWGVTFNTVGQVAKDACNRSAGAFERAEVDTAGELAAAMAAWPGFEATSPEPISSGDYEGLKFTLVTTMDPKECPLSQMFTTASSAPVDTYPLVNNQGRPHRTEFRIFEADGGLLVVRSLNFPETSPFEEDSGAAFDPEAHAADLPALQSIDDSIQIGPFPQAQP